MEKNAKDKHSLKMNNFLTLPQQLSMVASPMAAIRDGANGSGAAGSGDGKPSSNPGSGAAGSGHGKDAKESTSGRSRSRSRSRTRSPFSAEVLQALGQQLGLMNAEPQAPGAAQPALPPPAVQPPLPPPAVSQPPSPRATEAESVAVEQAASLSGSGTATTGGTAVSDPTPASSNSRESTPAADNAAARESTPAARELCSECNKFVPSSCSEKPELDSCTCPRCPMCWDRIPKDHSVDVETLDCMHVSWLGRNASPQ